MSTKIELIEELKHLRSRYEDIVLINEELEKELAGPRMGKTERQELQSLVEASETERARQVKGLQTQLEKRRFNYDCGYREGMENALRLTHPEKQEESIFSGKLIPELVKLPGVQELAHKQEQLDEERQKNNNLQIQANQLREKLRQYEEEMVKPKPLSIPGLYARKEALEKVCGLLERCRDTWEKYGSSAEVEQIKLIETLVREMAEREKKLENVVDYKSRMLEDKNQIIEKQKKKIDGLRKEVDTRAEQIRRFTNEIEEILTSNIISDIWKNVHEQMT